MLIGLHVNFLMFAQAQANRTPLAWTDSAPHRQTGLHMLYTVHGSLPSAHTPINPVNEISSPYLH